MNTIDNSPVRKKFIIAGLLILAVAAAVLSATPAIQSKLKSFYLKDERLILAKINARYGTQANEFLIFKIKDSYGLQIEIYEVTAEPQPVFRQKFELYQDTDAYITLDRNTTNLALSDVDKDGQVDILAPSVDRNGNLRLNTFRYNNELNNFEAYTNE